MGVINSFTTYTGKQSEFKELVMDKLKGYLGLKELGFDMVENIQSNKIMYKDQYLEKITKKRVGCSPATTSTGTGLAINTFNLTVTDMEVSLDQCAAQFDATIAEVLRKKGTDINNLEGTEIESYSMERVAEAAALDIYRIIILGDTTLSDSNYTMIDGMFKKLKAGVLAADGTTSAIAAGGITANSLLPANIVATLDTVWDAQPYELKFLDDASKVWYVTDPVWRAWEKYLSSTQFSGVGAQRDALVNGIPTLTYRGMPLVNLKVISKYLDNDFTNGSPGTALYPNRIILTEPSNHYIATDTMTDTASAEMWYDRTLDKNFTRMRYKIGYNYAIGHFNVIAGF